MVDLERLVLNMHTMDDIVFASAPEQFLQLRTDGRLSPFYVNARDITGFSKEAALSIEEQRHTRDLAITAFCEVLDETGEPYDHLYGLPQAMTQMAGMIAQRLGVSSLWGRVGGKQYGMSSSVHGRFATGDTVRTLDNAITTGGPMLDAAETLRAAGLTVPQLAVLIDREDGGRLNLLEATPKIELDAAIGMRTAIAILIENGRLTPQQIEWTTAYYEQYGVDRPSDS